MCIADDLEEAPDMAQTALDSIEFDAKHFRNDTSQVALSKIKQLCNAPLTFTIALPCRPHASYIMYGVVRAIL